MVLQKSLVGIEQCLKEILTVAENGVKNPMLFGVKKLEKKLHPRLVLQLFGTDCMRDGFDNGIWVSLVKKKLLENPGIDYVIPDVRFENEINMIKEVGGEVWVVVRGQTIRVVTTISKTKYRIDNIHSSEYLVKAKKDYVIDNNGTIDNPRDQVSIVLKLQFHDSFRLQFRHTVFRLRVLTLVKSLQYKIL